jgi:hypothetical protein
MIKVESACARMLATAAAVLVLSTPALGQDLVLKRVLLSSGGVAYFEHEAVVEGDGELTLDVRLDQVDDVLKSIVVFDDVGGVGSIRLPGRSPLAEVFRDLPFDRQALASAAWLLSSLQGAEISVRGRREIEGRLIGVEAEKVALPDNAGVLSRNRVSVLTERGVQQFVLEEADAVRFVDPVLQAQVDEALAALARHRVRDRRTLVIGVPGEGRRLVRVGYVVGAPLWKASYRLSIDGDGHEGLLQGWAVIENLSGVDWNQVELTVASGNPVTFRQALYTAYFVDRPEIPVEVLGRVLPPPDTGTVALRQEVAEAMAPEEAEYRGGAGGLGGEAMMMADIFEEPQPAPGREARARREQAAKTVAPAAMARAALAAVREEAATQVVFRLPEPVTVASGQSLMVPIVDAAVGAETLALYQPATHTRHPLATVRLENDTGTGLPPGVITLYEQGDGATYVGDARLAPLPAGETRLLSFALDQKVVIDREVDTARHVAKGTISRGVLRLSVRRRETTTYRISSSARDERQLLLEHPRRAGWELVEPDAEGVELAEHAYRIPVTVGAGAEHQLTVSLERPVLEEVSIADLWTDELEAYASSRDLSAELRRAFERLAVMRAEVDRLRSRIDYMEGERADIYDDQARLRENLYRLSSDSDLGRRYIAKMAEQEDRLDQLEVEQDEVERALDAAENALAEAIHDLVV